MTNYQFFVSDNAGPQGQLARQGDQWTFVGENRMNRDRAKAVAFALIAHHKRVRVFAGKDKGKLIIDL